MLKNINSCPYYNIYIHLFTNIRFITKIYIFLHLCTFLIATRECREKQLQQ